MGQVVTLEFRCLIMREEVRHRKGVADRGSGGRKKADLAPFPLPSLIIL